MSDGQYHERYEVRIGDATRVVVQDDYRVDEAIIKALRQLRREKVDIVMPAVSALLIRVRKVR